MLARWLRLYHGLSRREPHRHLTQIQPQPTLSIRYCVLRLPLQRPSQAEQVKERTRLALGAHQSASGPPSFATSTPSAGQIRRSIELGPNLNIGNLLESIDGNTALRAQDIICQKRAHVSPRSQAAATRELISQAHERSERAFAAVSELCKHACD